MTKKGKANQEEKTLENKKYFTKLKTVYRGMYTIYARTAEWCSEEVM